MLNFRYSFPAILLLLILAIPSFAEGTREMAPNPSDSLILNIRRNSLEPFAWYGNTDPDSRLNIHIEDYTNEIMYFGFQQAADMAGIIYYRIKDPDGNIVFGPVGIPGSPAQGYIENYNEAVNGPSALVGPAGYNANYFSPAKNGDYYIEFNRNHPTNISNSECRISYFDITVADTTLSQEIKGRVYSKNWGFNSSSYSDPANGSLYVYSNDSVVTRLDLNGIKTFRFYINCNSFGTTNTGNVSSDRRSVNGRSTQAEFKIFLNDPDSTVYPTGRIAKLSTIPPNITGCAGNYCIETYFEEGGLAEILLNFNGLPGYQAGTEDTLILKNVIKGLNCIQWNGKDALGNDIGDGVNISLAITLKAGLTHFPVYDVELNENGFIVSGVRPFTSVTRLFYDDSQIPDGSIELTGCSSPCHSWDNTFGQDPEGRGFGNLRTVNTWWYGFLDSIQFTVPFYQCTVPTAVDDSVQTTEFTMVYIDVSANDFDDDANIDKSSVSTIGLIPPANGTIVSIDNISGEIAYLPDSSFNGFDSFEYAICDSTGLCDTASVFITVVKLDTICNTVNRDTFTAVKRPQDTSILWSLPPGANIFSSSGDTVIVVNWSSVSQGLKSVCWTPQGLYGTGNPKCENVFVIICNTKPVAVRDTISLFEDDSIAFSVSINDTDIDGNLDLSSISIIGSQPPSNGVLSSINMPAGYITYTGNPDFYGTDSFAYQICDSLVFCDTAWVIIDVIGVQDFPSAVNDTLFISEDDVGVFIPVLSNDFDADGDSLIISILSGPNSGGIASILYPGIEFTPPSNYFGNDTIAYTINDMNGGVDTAFVFIFIAPVNDHPVAGNDTITIPEDTLNVTIDVQKNDLDVEGNSLNTIITNSPSSGGFAAVINNDSVLYSPPLHFFGIDTFTYVIYDGNGGSDTAMVFINVLPVNDIPVAINDYAITLEDTVNFLIDILTNDFDADNEPLITSVLNGPSSGSAFLLNNDTISYTPLPDFFGNDTLTYSITDSSGAADSAYLIITVIGINDPIIAIPDYAVTTEDNAVEILVGSNDIDVEDDINIPSLSIVQASLNFSLIVDTVNYSIICLPDPDYYGTDSFLYAVCDNGIPVYCDTTVVYVTVLSQNDPPIAVNDILSINEDTTNVFIDALANDYDVEGSDLVITILSTPSSGGSASLSGDSILYNPPPDFFGSDTIVYQVCDTGLLCDTAYILIDINNINDDPVAMSDVVIINEDTFNVIIDVQSNDFDPDGDSLITIVPVGPFSGGTVIVINGDSLLYTPPPNFTGQDIVIYIIDDGNGGVDTGIVVIHVNPLNDPPQANDDFITIPEDTLNVTIDVQANDTDIDGDTVFVTSVLSGSVQGGSTLVINNDSILYTPPLNFNGQDTIVYVISDLNGATDTAFVIITVVPVNDAPIAEDDSATTVPGMTVVIDVQSNDVDVEGDILQTSIFIGPSNGAAIVLSSDSISYTADLGFSGTDTIVYIVDDLNGGRDTAIVVINVILNTAPVAVDDANSTFEELTVITDVVSNDIDPDTSDMLTITIIGDPSKGVASVSADDIIYTPSQDFSGMDTITYQLCDNGMPVLCDTAILVITVIEINDKPIARDDTVSTLMDSLLDIKPLANDTDVEGQIDTSTLSVISGPSNGSYTIDPVSGVISYTPMPGYTGSDTIVYSICDQGIPVLCDTALILIEITMSLNNAPVAVNDTITITEDTFDVVIDVQFNDTDIDGDPLVTNILSASVSGGTAMVLNADSITYTPSANYNGQDTIVYTISDGNGGIDTALVIITIIPVNDAPQANDDSVSVIENTINVVIDVQINDIDPDGDVLLTSIIYGPSSGGTAIVLNGDSILYSPPVSFTGVDTILYIIDDGNGGMDTGLVIIHVDPLNDPPQANNDLITIPEDTFNVIIDVQANDTDTDGDSVFITSILSGSVQGGTASVINSDSILYTPPLNFNGLDTIAYVITDQNGGSDTAFVIITVVPVNDAPIAVDDYVAAGPGLPVVIDVQSNDVDVDGDVLQTSIFVGPSNGTAIVLSSDSISYTADTGFSGTDTIVYIVDDQNGGMDTAIVVISVSLNTVPVAVDDSNSTFEELTVITDVISNDSDPDTSDMLSITIIGGPSNGIASVSVNNIIYTPSLDFAGIDTITYQLCDNGTPVLCDTAILVITVIEINDKPIARDDTVSTIADSILDINPLANDFDVEGQLDTSSVMVISGPLNGSFTIDPVTGVITYTPSPGFTGQDTIVYSVCDQGIPVLCDTALILIEVTALINNAPLAVNDIITIPEDTSGVVIDVQSNDSDPDGDPLLTNILSVSTSGGTAMVLNGDSIVYTPAANYNGQDTIVYTISDGQGGMDTALVVITIAPVNDAPFAIDDFDSTPQDSSSVIFVLDNDFDIDSGQSLDTTSLVIVIDAQNGSAAVNPNGIVLYTPDTGFAGFDTFYYSICDNGSPVLCDTAQVIINVGIVLDQPTALNDSIVTNEDEAVVVYVLDNDSDISNPLDTTSLMIISGPDHGSVTIDPGGGITYLPDTNYYGTDSFAYLICDAEVTPLCDTAIVYVQILPVNDAPIAVNDSTSSPQGSTLVINPLTNDTDVENAIDTSSLAIVSGPSNGSAVVNPGGSITYDPDSGFVGSDTLYYTVCDTGVPVLCDTAIIVISITEVLNQPPLAVNDIFAVTEDSLSILTVIDNDNDSDGMIDTATLTIIENPLNGSVSIVSGVVSYQADTNYFGPDTFQYSICDNGTPVLCDTATVFVTVLPVNDPPEANDDTITIAENSGSTIIPVLNNDLDPEGDSLTISIVTAGSNGSAALDSNMLTYTPDSNFFGIDTLTYSICDNGGLCDTATVFITVTFVNEAPVLPPDSVSVPEDSLLTIDVISNVTDPDNNIDTSSVTVLGGPYHGPVTVDTTTGVITYVPDTNYFGPDTIVVTICDNGIPVYCDTSLIIINVIPVNDLPVAVNDSVSTIESQTITIDHLLNDFDVDGDILITSIIQGPSNGTALVVNGDSIQYSPDNGFTGNDSIIYQIDDGNGGFDTALIVIVVTINQDPVAVDDTVFTDPGIVIVIDVQSNDFDPEGDALITSILSVPTSGGIATVINSDSISYTPPLGFTGIDTIIYIICDPLNNCDTAIVTIFISSLNNFPTAVDDPVTMSSDPIDIDVLSNDFDIDGDSIIVSGISSSPVNGTVTVNTDGSITYTPDQNYTGIDSFSYIICDNGVPVLCDTATVYIIIVDLIAIDDQGSVGKGNSIDIRILLNDTIPAASDTSIFISNSSVNGVALVNPDGTITYTADFDAPNGIDSFQYTICIDITPSITICETAWVYIFVGGGFPGGFSPDGDGFNDVFYVAGLEDYINAELRVFNRYGDEVWNSGGPYQNDWGGFNFNGEPLPDGTYYYIVEFNDGMTESIAKYLVIHRGN